MTAFDRLIADYQSADNHLAGDGYNNRQADQLIAAARSEREELVEALKSCERRLSLFLTQRPAYTKLLQQLGHPPGSAFNTLEIPLAKARAVLEQHKGKP